jgi:hypothetical protein
MASGHTTCETPGSDSITRKGSPSEPGTFVSSSSRRLVRAAFSSGDTTTVS